MGLKDLFKILVIILGIPCYLLRWSYINIFFANKQTAPWSIIITMMINRSLVKQSNRLKKEKEREKSVYCQYQTVFALLSSVKCNVWMFVKPNTNPNTRLSKWVLKTISTVLLSYVKFKR